MKVIGSTEMVQAKQWWW